MTGKLFGLLAAAFLFTSQAASYGGWCGSSNYCCTTHHHHCCYTPCCCYYPPCPPCPPPTPCYRDCIYNATNRVLTVSVTFAGGSDSRSCLQPGQWFYFSYNPAVARIATVTAYDRYAGQFVQSRQFLLIRNPAAPHQCIRIRDHHTSGASSADERMPLPEGEEGAPAAPQQ